MFEQNFIIGNTPMIKINYKYKEKNKQIFAKLQEVPEKNRNFLHAVDAPCMRFSAYSILFHILFFQRRESL